MEGDIHLQQLEAWFHDCPGALIAFSGGVDSSLVAALARRFLNTNRQLAVISASPSLKRSDLSSARGFADELNIPLRVIVTVELENEAYRNNPTNRCYFCKSTLYNDLIALEGFDDWWILNGTNIDDLGDHRPGLQAAKERRVRSPLAECGLTKNDVRTLAKKLNLQCWDKPASPCLASRIPYGEMVTFEKLKQIELAEEALYSLGFPINRVRHLGTLARIEVPKEEIEQLKGLSDALIPAFEKAGFDEIEIDPEGHRSGKLNDVLPSEEKRTHTFV